MSILRDKITIIKARERALDLGADCIRKHATETKSETLTDPVVGFHPEDADEIRMQLHELADELRDRARLMRREERRERKAQGEEAVQAQG